MGSPRSRPRGGIPCSGDGLALAEGGAALEEDAGVDAGCVTRSPSQVEAADAGCVVDVVGHADCVGDEAAAKAGVRSNGEVVARPPWAAAARVRWRSGVEEGRGREGEEEGEGAAGGGGGGTRVP